MNVELYRERGHNSIRRALLGQTLAGYRPDGRPDEKFMPVSVDNTDLDGMML